MPVDPQRLWTASTLLAVWLLVTVLVVGVWDVYVTARGAPEDTVSAVMRAWSLDWPMLPLAIGILIGHLFWR